MKIVVKVYANLSVLLNKIIVICNSSDHFSQFEPPPTPNEGIEFSNLAIKNFGGDETFSPERVGFD